jgi:hypothetical protein
MEVNAINIYSTPEELKLTKTTAEELSCAGYKSEVAAQIRIISPIDIGELAKQAEDYNYDVAEIITQVDISRAFTFPVSELIQLMNTASRECRYIRIYFGVKNSKMTAFALPVDENLEHILDENMVAVSELPCPPKTGCPNDRIVKLK